MTRTFLLAIALLLAGCSADHDGAHDVEAHDIGAHDDDHAHGDGEGHSSHDDAGTGNPAELSTAVTTGRSTATVLYVSEEGDFLTLDHGPIPEINMGAMRMGFDVAGGVDISTLSEGDAIIFDMEAADSFGIRVTAFCVPARDGADCLD